jgi:PTH2 family peptidyl-tRNA hydrolase
MEYKLVVAVRRDIKISPGKMAAQVAHAAVSCAMKAKTSEKDLYSEWMREGQRKVILKVDDLGELERIEKKAAAAGLITDKITDAGLTEIPPGTITCLGVGPAKEEDIDRITGHLKLA